MPVVTSCRKQARQDVTDGFPKYFVSDLVVRGFFGVEDHDTRAGRLGDGHRVGDGIDLEAGADGMTTQTVLEQAEVLSEAWATA